MARKFYGWWITAAAFVTFGLSVGIPYYNIGFFFDYFQREFNWTRPQITLGFPIAAALTIWAGPLLIHRFSPRKLILVGTPSPRWRSPGSPTCAACCWFTTDSGSSTPPDTSSQDPSRTS